MSAWGIGAGTGRSTSLVGRAIRWIPGDALAIYGLGIVLLPRSEGVVVAGRLPRGSITNTVSMPYLLSLTWLGAMTIVAMGLTLAGIRLRARSPVDGCSAVGSRLWFRIGGVGVSFLLWALCMPGNGWLRFQLVLDRPGFFALIGAGAGLAVGVVLDAVDSRSIRERLTPQ